MLCSLPSVSESWPDEPCSAVTSGSGSRLPLSLESTDMRRCRSQVAPPVDLSAPLAAALDAAATAAVDVLCVCRYAMRVRHSWISSSYGSRDASYSALKQQVRDEGTYSALKQQVRQQDASSTANEQVRHQGEPSKTSTCCEIYSTIFTTNRCFFPYLATHSAFW